jgi:hypothetical protein
MDLVEVFIATRLEAVNPADAPAARYADDKGLESEPFAEVGL